MKKVFLAILTLISYEFAFSEEAADSSKYIFGVYADYFLPAYELDFPGSEFPEPNCCPMFEDQSGTGYSIGIDAARELGGGWLAGLRLGYTASGAELTINERKWFALFENKRVRDIEGIIKHSLDFDFNSITIEPTIRYSAIGGLHLTAGAYLDYFISDNFAQSEELVEPVSGVFENGGRVRNKKSGAIKDLSAFHAGLLGGAYWDIPVNQSGTLIVSPEIFYRLPLSNLHGDLKWRESGLRIGLAVRMRPGRIVEITPPPAAEPVPEPALPKTELVKKEADVLEADIFALSDNKIGNKDTVALFVVEEFISRQLYPLLPYVFFEENSSELPARYTRILPEDKEFYNIEGRFYDSDPMTVYYDLLNIVGARMTAKPNARLTLVGCNCDCYAEKKALDLSGERAETVKKYLTQIWGIADNRIILAEPRNLPEKNSKGDSKEIYEENRRVEMYSDDESILDPIFASDTLRKAQPPTIFFSIAASASAGIKSWQLSTKQRTTQGMETYLDRFDYGKPQTTLIWDLRKSGVEKPRNENPLDYSLKIVDGRDSTITVSKSIPVEQLTIRKKRQQRLADVEVNRFRLIMFDFNSDEVLGAHKRIINIINEYLAPASKVLVEGQTDFIGSESHNLKLSTDRAKAVANALFATPKNLSAKGLGESELYDNDTPEGRHYNRTVTIKIETPIY